MSKMNQTEQYNIVKGETKHRKNAEFLEVYSLQEKKSTEEIY